MLLTLVATFIAGCAFGIGVCMLAVRPVRPAGVLTMFLIVVSMTALVLARV
jgi:hypothetical protein